MISEIRGKIKRKKESSVVIDCNGISYEILVPPAIMKSLDSAKSEDGSINFKEDFLLSRSREFIVY